MCACDVAVRSVVPPSADLNEQSLLLEVWDKDRIGKNDFMGAMVFRLADLQEDKTGCVCARVCVPLCLCVCVCLLLFVVSCFLRHIASHLFLGPFCC